MGVLDAPGYNRSQADSRFAVGDPATTRVFPVDRYSSTVYSDANGGPAIQAAIDAAVAAGGGVVLLRKSVTFSTPIHHKTTSVPVTFQGTGSARGVGLAQATALRYTGTGSATAFDCSDATGLSFRDFSLRYTSGSFTGTLLDLSGVSVRDGSLHTLDNMLIRPESTLDTHSALVRIERTHSLDFNNCILIGSKAIYGKADDSGFSNRIRISGGYMQGRTLPPIWNPDMAWVLDSVTFETLNSGGAGAIGHDAGVHLRSLESLNCYYGDDLTTVTGTWIRVNGGSLRVQGGIATAMAAGSSVVQVDEGAMRALELRGFEWTGPASAYLVDLTTTGGHGYVIIGPVNWASSSVPDNLVNGTLPTKYDIIDPGGNRTVAGGPVFPDPIVTSGITITGGATTTNLLTANQATAEDGNTVGVDTNNNVASLTSSTNFSAEGSRSWRIVASANAADTSFGTGVTNTAYRRVASPGMKYTFLGLGLAGSVSRTAKLSAFFIDSTGAAIAGVAGQPQGATVALPVGSFTNLPFMTVTAPSGTVAVVLTVRVQNALAGEEFYFDKLQIAVGTSTTWVSPGGAPSGISATPSGVNLNGATLTGLPNGVVPSDAATVAQLQPGRIISSVAVDTAAGAAANGTYFYLVSGTSVLTLPTAVSNTAKYTVKNAGSGTVTVATTSSQTIDGSTTAALGPNDSIDLISDNANWRVI